MWTVEMIREKLNTDQTWLERGVLAIDARQTQDEQETEETRHLNRRGWNSSDARFGSYLARFIRGSYKPLGQRLSGDFVVKARRMMHKYAGQLLRVIEEKTHAHARV